MEYGIAIDLGLYKLAYKYLLKHLVILLRSDFYDVMCEYIPLARVY